MLEPVIWIDEVPLKPTHDELVSMPHAFYELRNHRCCCSPLIVIFDHGPQTNPQSYFGNAKIRAEIYYKFNHNKYHIPYHVNTRSGLPPSLALFSLAQEQPIKGYFLVSFVRQTAVRIVFFYDQNFDKALIELQSFLVMGACCGNPPRNRPNRSVNYRQDQPVPRPQQNVPAPPAEPNEDIRQREHQASEVVSEVMQRPPSLVLSRRRHESVRSSMSYNEPMPEPLVPISLVQIRIDEGREEQANSLNELVQILAEGIDNEETRARNFFIVIRLLEILQGAPVGVSQEQRRSLNLRQATEDGVCAICQDKVSVKQIVYGLPCSHYFHQSCLDPWLERSRNCPMCREPIVRG